jgi:EAL domain-containing protein (putative c-di-GMP-specific phosphodiesterase class I)/GGDEF domain-containing protein
MSTQATLELERIIDTNAKSLPHALYSQTVRRGRGPLAGLIRSDALHPVFQPLVSLSDGSIYSHEALIRGPQNSSFHTPDTLLAAAVQENLNFEFETFCIAAALDRWGKLNECGRLFVNISAEVLVQVLKRCGRAALLELISDLNVLPRMLVLEITEYERVADMDDLANVVREIRSAGVSLALDDFGDGRSSLRLWSQLKPEYVKIDKYFTKDISQHADKLKTIQALQQIAAIFDSALVAEGIETENDLRVLRDLGIAYGQGYFLGRPAPLPREQVEAQAWDVMRDPRVSVFPELRRASNAGALSRLTVLDAPTVEPSTTNEALGTLFLNHPKLHAIAVLEGTRPVGIINRSHFMDEFSKLYYREIWGRKPCLMHANLAPRLIERNHNVDDLVGILTSDDQRYLMDGFIVTDNGRYAGLGTGEQLVRSVTETRIEAARHANPLTFLPGNIPISQHIERLLNSGAEFVACYADLNNFKPFNDQYGYWRGDEMIRLLARVAVAHCDPQRDFVGHVGGDDFIILYQSTDWHAQCLRIIAEFGSLAIALFDDSARQAGGIQADDRHGVPRFFPFTTLSIGAVKIRRNEFATAEQVASAAARAKHDAKTAEKGLFVQEVSLITQ